MSEMIARNGKQITLSITKENADIPLGEFLRSFLGFSKAQIKSMKFREKGLCINGVKARINQILAEGDLVEILLEEKGEASEHLMEEEGIVDILYEDDDLIAVWKEAGVVVHPSHGHYKDTLSNRLHGYFAQKGEAVVIRSIGRLDKDTQGILVFAKNQVAAARLWAQKEDGRFQKEYLAICEGRFPQTDFEGWTKIKVPIKKNPGTLMEMQTASEDDAEAKPAVTYYQVLEQNEDTALIRVRIETGRTHQIRVHMASIGHPLRGDILYGPEKDQKEQMVLCAWKAELLQPFSGEKLNIMNEKWNTRKEKKLKN